MNAMDFLKIAAGVYMAKTGDAIDPVLSLVKNEPKLENINENFIDESLPFDGVYTEKINNKTVVCIPKDNSERFYGPGLRFQKIATNFSALHMRCDH